MNELVSRLRDLIEQATKERSHYYVAKTAQEAADALEQQAKRIEELERENSKIRSALEIVHFKREPWQ